MRSVTLANTDLVVSRIGFGTSSLHHVFRSSEQLRLLRDAIDSGMTHVDTAPSYGDGLAESAVGRLPGVVKAALTITTKIGLHSTGIPTDSAWKVHVRRVLARAGLRTAAPTSDLDLKACAKSLEASLSRLRVSAIDLLLLHEPELDMLDPDALVGWLMDCRRTGKIRHWGVAGERHRVERVAAAYPKLAHVVQTRHGDGIGPGSPLARALGHQPQITYGALRAHPPVRVLGEAGRRLRDALAVNPSGMVLMSTKHRARLQAARLANP